MDKVLIYILGKHVDCEWGAWTVTSGCSEECGEGFKTKTRAKTREAAFNGHCEGALTEKEACIKKACEDTFLGSLRRS